MPHPASDFHLAGLPLGHQTARVLYPLLLSVRYKAVSRGNTLSPEAVPVPFPDFRHSLPR